MHSLSRKGTKPVTWHWPPCRPGEQASYKLFNVPLPCPTPLVPGSGSRGFVVFQQRILMQQRWGCARSPRRALCPTLREFPQMVETTVVGALHLSILVGSSGLVSLGILAQGPGFVHEVGTVLGQVYLVSETPPTMVELKAAHAAFHTDNGHIQVLPLLHVCPAEV